MFVTSFSNILYLVSVHKVSKNSPIDIVGNAILVDEKCLRQVASNRTTICF